MMNDKAPYVVSLILGVLGWLVGHMVDRIIAAPTLEYHVEETESGGRRGLDIELTNITRDKSFDSLRARIVIPNATRYSTPTLVSAEPAFEGTTAPETKEDTTNFILPRMMPGAEIDFGVAAASIGEPRLSIWSDAKEPIRLQERGLETFFAKHEIEVLAGLFLIWLAALALWAKRAAGKPIPAEAESGAYPVAAARPVKAAPPVDDQLKGGAL